MPDKKLYDSFHISAIIVKKLDGTITGQEEAELQEWLVVNENNRALFREITDEAIRRQDIKKLKAFKEDNALKKVRKRIIKEQSTPPEVKKNKKHLPQIAAAAAVILLVSGLGLYLIKSSRQKPSIAVNNKILPGSNKATLSLSNGTQIDLQAARNGTIASQGHSLINKTATGELSYQTSQKDSVNITQAGFNTLNVPRGGQYQLMLPDGSRVWLNSQSSLKYPVAFNGSERAVELSGEAYFEVTHDSKRPFKVHAANQTVEVLGTHFNIECYPEEETTTTTLLQGSVKVSKGSYASIIKPGEKVVNLKNAGRLNVLPANAEEALAWKNGYFDFNNERIQDIMKRISRWYDVDVVYEGKTQDKQFWGTFSRSKSLNSLLRSLEQTKTIHFKIEGRRIIVMP